MSWGRLQDHRPTKPSSMSVSTTRSETASSTATLSPSSEPIAIPTSPFSPPSHHQTSFDSSSSFLGQAVDEPLQGLLPALSNIVVSSSSGSDDCALLGESPELRSPLGRQGGGSGFARRVVSAPMPHSTSPRSPLAAASSPDPLSSSPRRRSAQFPFAGSTPPASGPTASSLHPSPTSRRRRSSVSLSSSTGSAPLFGSFVGSFEHSLLSGRLSALPSLPLPFLASIGVLGSADSPTRLRCPPHLTDVPFGAFYYTTEEGTKSSAPYVGTIELDSHYFSLLSSISPLDPPIDPPPSPAPTAPRFPGYQVPPRGQVQLVIKNANSTAIKLFLIPYDLSTLTPGTKTFLRQKSYTVEASANDESKGRLRYAVHLQFCCPATKNKELKFYLHGNLRVVFASRGLDSTEKLRIVAEGPEGSQSASDGQRERDRHAPYSGPSLEWEMARKKVKEREKLRTSRLERTLQGEDPQDSPQQILDTPASSLPSPRVHDPDGVILDLSRSSSPLDHASSALDGHNDFSGTSSTSKDSLYAVPQRHDSALFSPNKSSRPSLALSFVRPPSPAPAFLQHRTPSVSGLSSSRPPSRAGSDGSGAVNCGR